MLLVESLERSDRFALGLGGRQCTREDWFTIHQNRAAATLGLRLATVLGGRNAEKIAQHIEQRQPLFVGQIELNLVAVNLARKLTNSSSRFGCRRHGSWPREKLRNRDGKPSVRLSADVVANSCPDDAATAAQTLLPPCAIFA